MSLKFFELVLCKTAYDLLEQNKTQDLLIIIYWIEVLCLGRWMKRVKNVALEITEKNVALEIGIGNVVIDEAEI